MLCVGLYIATWIQRQSEILYHALVNRVHEAHGQQDKISLEFKFAAGYLLHLPFAALILLPVNPYQMQ